MTTPDPITVHHVPLPPAAVPCPTCRRGCGCDPAKGEACQHYGCWGQRQIGTCPGVVYEIARYEAERAHLRARARLVAVRRARHSVAYARAVAAATERARLEVAARIAEHDRTRPTP